MTLNSLTPELAETLRSSLPAEIFEDAQPKYLEEPRGRWAGRAGLIARPRTTGQVANLIRFANAHSVAVVPYAGGTGLVGGQILQDGPDPLILSVDRLSGIKAAYPEENVMIVGAGTVLADVRAAAEACDRLFPLSLASEGSARIGGLLATNAGGTGVLRYGNARDLCLGVEAVLPNGEIFEGLSRLRKDNTGYDLRNLLVGSEGTLGVISAASLKLYPRPASEGTALFSVPNPRAALSLLSLARAQLGEGISAFELMHRQGFDFLEETGLPIRNPWDKTPEWCVLIEVGLAAGLDPVTGLEGLFVAAHEAGLAQDGLVAQSKQQQNDFWSVREHIPEANRRIGSVSSHDISVPLGAIPDFIEEGRKRIEALGAFRINCFGHVGDGNLHYNVFPMPGKTRADHMHERDEVKHLLHNLTHELGGSVSAEHGVGRLKVDDIERYGHDVKLQAMRAIKTALDPRGIMNPGAVLRYEGS